MLRGWRHRGEYKSRKIQVSLTADVLGPIATSVVLRIRMPTHLLVMQYLVIVSYRVAECLVVLLYVKRKHSVF